MKSSVKKLVVWRKNGKCTKKHLWELQRSYVGNGEVPRSSNQGWWKSTGFKDDTHIRAEEKAAQRAVDKARRDMEADVYS